jgi:ATP-dependent DNA helicase RecQ
MRKKNFKAGYISDGVTHVINEFRNSLDLSKETDKKKLNKINGLLEYVSSFNVEFPTDHNPNYKNIHPVLAVVNNIITRGLPTRVPIEVEEQLVTLGINTPSTKQYEYLYDKTQIDIDYDEVFKLLHIIDPGL